jgi:hypothetical protein
VTIRIGRNKIGPYRAGLPKKLNTRMKGGVFMERTLTFKSLRGESFRGRVLNPQAPIGRVAAKCANRFGIAGSFEIISPRGMTVPADTTLGDLPEEENEYVLSSELTPA